MTSEQREKLQRAYALMVAYDDEYGNEPIHDEAMELIRQVIED